MLLRVVIIVTEYINNWEDFTRYYITITCGDSSIQ